ARAPGRGERSAGRRTATGKSARARRSVVTRYVVRVVTVARKCVIGERFAELFERDPRPTGRPYDGRVEAVALLHHGERSLHPTASRADDARRRDVVIVCLAVFHSFPSTHR